MSVTTIVLTGGPCGGKSTALSRIEQELTQKGYKVFVVPETATEIILGGIKPSEFDESDFQESLVELQLTKERIYKNIAKKYSEDKGVNCVIVFDRGLLDSKAFMSKIGYNKLLNVKNIKEIIARDSYDGVFHLVTAANGAEEFYTLANNAARSETPEQARKADLEIINTWSGHPHLRIIGNEGSFESKMNKLMAEIYALLGVPVPVEIERKYLVKLPNLQELKSKYCANKVDIIQTYLKCDGDGFGGQENCRDERYEKERYEKERYERRVRQRGADGVYSYYYTEKFGSGIKRIEIEKRISEEEYLRYLMEADTRLHQIRKNRYVFVYKNRYIELDVYENDLGKNVRRVWGCDGFDQFAIVEVELLSEDEEVELPAEIEVVREITGDENWGNRRLSEIM